MTSRRTFIQIAGAAALISGLPALGAASTRSALYKVIYDRRFPAAEAFAAQAHGADVPLAAFSGDPTSVWFNDLYHHWQHTGAPVAGITEFQSYFSLDLMAQGAGWRTVYLAHHDRSHRLFGPRAMLRSPSALALSQTMGFAQEWSHLAARVVLEFPATAPIDRERSSILAVRDTRIRPDALVSWVIAPPSRTV